MPLTPADVHNVAFSKPPIGKRGYNEDEVDAFLDLVEGELARLIEENNDLRQQVEQLDQQLENARADFDDARAKASSGPMTSRMHAHLHVIPRFADEPYAGRGAAPPGAGPAAHGDGADVSRWWR